MLTDKCLSAQSNTYSTQALLTLSTVHTHTHTHTPAGNLHDTQISVLWAAVSLLLQCQCMLSTRQELSSNYRWFCINTRGDSSS